MPSSRLPKLLTLGATGLLAWWACAPIAGIGPSPAPLPDGAGTVHGGINGSYGPGIGTERCTDELGQPIPDTSCGPGLQLGPAIAAGQLYAMWDLGQDEQFQVGGTAGGGLGSGIFAGAIGRWYFLRQQRLRLGGEVQLGGLWGAIGVPLAVGLSDKVWLTTNPSVGYRVAYPFRVPVGVAIDLAEHWRLHVDVSGGAGGNMLDGGNVAGSVSPYGVWATVGLSLH